MTIEPQLDAILADLTPDEKIRLLHQHQPAVERHGLAEFHTGQEALHGVAWSGAATVFPQAIGLGSTWNPGLLRRIGDAVAKELRACHHGDRPQVGLNVWAPVVDLLRDPRAGRNEEGYSEDPYLTGLLSTAYCEGLSGTDPKWHATAPTLKHFLAYNNEEERVTTSADVRPRLLHEYYLRAFEPAVRSGAAKAVMLSYNLVNGRPNHISPYVNSVLRTWAPDLVVVSDAYAPTNLAGEQAYFATDEESHAAALRAGLDSFTDRGQDPEFTTSVLRKALDDGVIDQQAIDDAVRRLLHMRIRLGELEDPADVQYARLPPETVACEAHRALAREAVRQSVVLLRNDNLLPLDEKTVGSVVLIGPLIDDCLEDWYSGTLPYRVTPLDGMRARLGAARVFGVQGVDRIRIRIGEDVHAFSVYEWGEDLITLRSSNRKFLTRKENGDLVADQDQPNGWVVRETFRLHGTDTLEHVASGTRYRIEDFELLSSGADEAAEAARDADVAVVVAGNHPLVGARETSDRTTLDLPDAQSDLIRAVVAANPRTVLVIESGYPYALPWEDQHVPAIVWMSHGGQETGNGLADILFGDTSPAGRLTQTWYASTADLAASGEIGEYDIIRSGRTYLYSRTPPLYPFGHGLGYVDFAYSNVRFDGLIILADITNHGSMAADEVVQVYVRRVSPSRVEYPTKWLCGARRVHVRPGQALTVDVELRADDFAHWDVRQHRFVVEDGEYEVLVGRSAADIRGSAVIQVPGEALPARDPYQATNSVDFDNCERVRLVPQSTMSGDAVHIVQGGWISFYDMDFSSGATLVGVRVAHSEGDGCLEVRTASPTGELLARLEIPAIHPASDRGTPPEHSWRALYAPIPLTKGMHDIYLIAAAGGAGSSSSARHSGIRVSEFWFDHESTSPSEYPQTRTLIQCPKFATDLLDRDETV